MEKSNIYRRVTRPLAAFEDRRAAGEALRDFIRPARQNHALVLALPRGGVPVAEPLAEALGAPLEPVSVRKLPIPESPEMGFGAITADGTLVLNNPVVESFRIGEEVIREISDEVIGELQRRSSAYEAQPLPDDLRGTEVYIVDDGLATGYTVIAAAEMVTKRRPAALTLAVPVSPANSLKQVESYFDSAWCLFMQDLPPFAVASFYRDFHDLSDEEVLEVLKRRRAAVAGDRHPSAR